MAGVERKDDASGCPCGDCFEHAYSDCCECRHCETGHPALADLFAALPPEAGALSGLTPTVVLAAHRAAIETIMEQRAPWCGGSRLLHNGVLGEREEDGFWDQVFACFPLADIAQLMATARRCNLLVRGDMTMMVCTAVSVVFDSAVDEWGACGLGERAQALLDVCDKGTSGLGDDQHDTFARRLRCVHVGRVMGLSSPHMGVLLPFEILNREVNSDAMNAFVQFFCDLQDLPPLAAVHEGGWTRELVTQATNHIVMGAEARAALVDMLWSVQSARESKWAEA